jgi:murein DD-endopeptidase MepM/ murein hydrolase activator NlpD
MQILLTHSRAARAQVLHINRWQLGGLLALLLTAMLLLSGAVYSFVVLKATREQWPIVSTLVRPMVQGEFEQRDRFMRDNLNAMAQKVGEMQAKLVRLESLSERVAGQVGLKPTDLKAPGAGSGKGATAAAGGQGGPYVPLSTPSVESLMSLIDQMGDRTDLHIDVFTLAESKLQEGRLAKLLMPSIAPVAVPVGSGFGFRPDPFTGRAALHAGIDFPAEPGTAVVAAAGGVVVSTESHPAYGNLVEIDHGNGLVTRYAHALKVLVRAGDVIKRGQAIAQVGNTGRSTGPHLHFEVLVDGTPQDPAKFLGAAIGK